MPYEKPWENLIPKQINTPFGSSKLPYSLDPTTQRTLFPDYYCENFQGQMENLSLAEADVCPWELGFPRSVSRMTRIQEDTPSSYLSTLLSDVNVVLAPAESGTGYWEHLQGQMENLSLAEADVCPWELGFPRSVSRMTRIQEDTPSSYLSTLLSDVNVVLAPAESGTGYWEHLQGQMENLSLAETKIRLSESKLLQSVGGMTQIQEDTLSSYFLSTHVNQPSDVVFVPAESGTAITDFTRLRNRQIEKQKLEISERFDVLAQREDNWDGYDSKKPTQPTLDHAKYLMEEFFDTIIGMKHPWITPFISSNEDGYITAEWYEEEREVHILIRENEAEYLQVWGINIYTEMHEDFLSRADYPKLWEWLLHGQKQQEINIHIEMHEDFPVVQII